MGTTIRDELLKLSDYEYKEFQKKLSPGTKNIIGVRLPLLRKLAKDLAKNDIEEFLYHSPEDYYEEIMLKGLSIGYAKIDMETRFNYIDYFIPKITSWGICDSFCNGLKFTKANLQPVWEFLKPYFHSKREFELRFAIVMLIEFYIIDDYIDNTLILLNKVKHDGYYVKMAVAWAISICFIKFPEKTMVYLKNNSLDDFTYNKSLQKITESLRIDNEMKSIIRNMKRK